MAFWDLVSIIILLTIRKHFYVPPDADVPPERRLLLEDAAADEFGSPLQITEMAKLLTLVLFFCPSFFPN
jgi:hypothetical protein